jgi:hypothetical protein
MTSGVRQRGVAAVVFLAIFAMILIGVLTTAFSSRSAQSDYDAKTFPVLAAAKEALIAYAVANSIAPGRLPCVYISNADPGMSDPCTSPGTVQLGRLPWKQLGMPVLRDASGECLWYAVSGNFAQTTALTTPINSDHALGQFTIKRNPAPIATLATNVIAVIFAPGPTVGSNDRTGGGTPTPCGGNTAVANYLDPLNAAATTTFYADSPSDTVNDRLVYITAADVLPRVERRIASEIAWMLWKYHKTKGYLPLASSFADPSNCTAGTYLGLVPQFPESCGGATWLDATGNAMPAWFINDGWNLLTYYAVAPPCTDAASVASCNSGIGVLTLTNGTATPENKKALVFEAGAQLAGQIRPPADVDDLLDMSQNKDGDTTYFVPTRSSSVNDVVVSVP